MRYIVFGAGAIGSLLGGYLARAGSMAVLVGRPAHVTRIGTDGLSIKDADGVHNIRVEATDSISTIQQEPGDIVFLCVKSQDTAKAMTELREWAKFELPVFCCQNGVHNEKTASEFFESTYGVVLTVAARYLGPGRIIAYPAKSLALGCYPSGVDDLADKVSDALGAAGFEATVDENVMAAKWSKLILNLGNAFNAITGLSILEARNSPESRDFLADLYEEGVRVLDGAGIEHKTIPHHRSVTETIRRLRQGTDPSPLPEDPDFNWYPSTWQDLQLGRGGTEDSSLNGEIVNLGKQVGIPTPINGLLLRLVEEMAAKGEPPGKYGVDELRTMLSTDAPSGPRL